jgi:hypothetical protein
LTQPMDAGGRPMKIRRLESQGAERCWHHGPWAVF